MTDQTKCNHTWENWWGFEICRKCQKTRVDNSTPRCETLDRWLAEGLAKGKKRGG